MGVLTDLYRVPPKIAEKAQRDPKVLIRLFEYEEVDGVTVHSEDIDKSWEDILFVLSETGPEEAEDALATAYEIPHQGRDIEYYTAAMVRDGAATLRGLRIDEVRERALRVTDLHDEWGRPIDERDLDYILGYLEKVIKFWQEAAAAGEAIFTSTS